jgi:predicted nucleotidyltransferase
MVEKIIKRSANKKKKDEIIRMVSTLIARHKEINSAYLHGSFLSGEVFADIDLGLLMTHTPENIIEYEFNVEIEIERRVNIPVDVRVLNNAPISFVQNVIRHGEVVLDNKPNVRSDFESYSLRKYFDFAPFRRRYLSEVINAPI